MAKAKYPVFIRLDDRDRAKLQELINISERSQPDVIRQLIRRARPEDFVPAVDLRRTRQPQKEHVA